MDLKVKEITEITDFSEFVKDIKTNNKYTVKFTVSEKEFSFFYSELSNNDNIQVDTEFKRWFKSQYGEKAEVEYDVRANLATQFQVWKMVSKCNKGLQTFEDFLNIPSTITGAMVNAIEKDLRKRYPHVTSIGV